MCIRDSQRYKGLGEMDAEQLWETTLNPETRMMKRVEIEDARLASSVTEILMGSDVPPRKKFIYEHAPVSYTHLNAPIDGQIEKTLTISEAGTYKVKVTATSPVSYTHLIGVLCYVAVEYVLWISGCLWPGYSISAPYCWFDLLLTGCLLYTSPMAMDSSRPFPLIRNKTLNIGALISKKEKSDKLNKKDKAGEPVSYTHLDVYKRQRLQSGDCQTEAGSNARDREDQQRTWCKMYHSRCF